MRINNNDHDETKDITKIIQKKYKNTQARQTKTYKMTNKQNEKSKKKNKKKMYPPPPTQHLPVQPR